MGNRVCCFDVYRNGSSIAEQYLKLKTKELRESQGGNRKTRTHKELRVF